MNIELVRGIPYFNKVNRAKLKQYNYLEASIDTDVVIIGGGISGAIACYTFATAGIDVVLVDSGRVGMANTSLATALLEYQLDDFADDLSGVMSPTEIINCYRANIDGLGKLDKFIGKYGNHCDYAVRDTLIYTLDKRDSDRIYKEYQFRIDNGLDCAYITGENNLEFNIAAGLRATKGGAEANPYLLTRQLLDVAEAHGAKIYENTRVLKLTKSGSGVVMDAEYGIKIKANKAILATGYDNSLTPEHKLCNRKLTYSIVTCPLDFRITDNLLMHDSESPYHYLRSTVDNRIIIGGEDKGYVGNSISGNVAEKKYIELYKYLVKLFPQINGVAKIDYKFCGAFAETTNNMGVIGELEPGSNIWCLYGYGANGIIYNFYGAGMLLDLYNGKSSSMAYLYSPDRKVY